MEEECLIGLDVNLNMLESTQSQSSEMFREPVKHETTDRVRRLTFYKNSKLLI